MPSITPELRAAIDVAKQRVQVESYYPKAMNAGLKGNAQGFWSGTALGLATGALGGGLISLALVAAAPVGMAATLIGWPLVLGFAGVGGTMGGGIGARIGAGSAAIAGVAAERERREKAEILEKDILASPEKQQEVLNAYRQNPVVEKNDTVGEIYATTPTSGDAFGKIVDWKTMAVTVTICALASMVLFGGSFLLAGGPLLGVAGSAISSGFGALGATTLGGALAVGAGAGAAMGVAFGTSYPPIFASFTTHVADLLSGKTVRGKTGFPPTKTVAESMAEARALQQDSALRQPLPSIVQPVPLAAAADIPTSRVQQASSLDRVTELLPELVR